MSCRPFLAVVHRVAASGRLLCSVLAMPGVRLVALSSLIARVPKGMLPLAMIMLLHQSTGSYAVAGMTAALVAIGDAATTPLQGRLVDRFCRGRVLVPIAGLHVAAIAALLILSRAHPANEEMIVGCAFVAGVGMPPISSAVKTVWPQLVGSDRLHSAYTVESLLQQLVFMSGPLLVAVLVVIAGPAAAVGVSAALSFVGTAVFVFASRSLTRGRASRRRSALGSPMVRMLVSSTVLQSVTFGALPVGLVAVTTDAGKPGLVGPLLAAVTVGGLLGTFLPASANGVRRYPRLVGGFAIALSPVAIVAPVPTGATLVALGACLTIAGLFLTPIAAASYVLVERATTSSNRTEAFAWLSTGQALGNAAGSMLAGIVLEHSGPIFALAMPSGAATIAVVLSHRHLRRGP